MLCDLPVTIHNGRYRLLAKLGHGGFGVTYSAIDTTSGSKVAVKMFWPHHIAGSMPDGKYADEPPKGTHTPGVERLRRRFLSEAKVMSRFDCADVVRITDYFVDHGNAFYVMAWIDGTDLDAMVRSRGALKADEAMRYVWYAGQGLDYLHRRHHAHLDIKPANIMIRSSDDMPVIIDFGITRQYYNSTVDSSHAESPSASSAGFAPPELYTPTGINEFSPETDVYSLAATLYFMLTGVTPPRASELVDKPLTFPAEPVVSVPLRRAIAAAMSPHRRKRPSTVDDFLKMLPYKPGDDTASQRGGIGFIARLFSRNKQRQ